MSKLSQQAMKSKVRSNDYSTTARLFAEMFGTFCLVFTGTGAIVINDISHGLVTHLGIALTFGLIVMAMIYTLGEVSGAHLNPAVTIGFWANRRLSGQLVGLYIASQVTGALLGSAVVRILFREHATLGSTAPAGSWMQSFVLEWILTLILMFVILRVSTGAKEKGITAGIAVGSVVALEALFAGPISGASMNPARSIGPAIVSGHLKNLWIYIVAPLLGSLSALFLFRIASKKQ